MFKLILELINRMLLFVAAFILVLGGINSIFGTNLGIKIGGDRIALPDEFLVVALVSVLLVVLSGLLSLALNFRRVIDWIKAEPLKIGGSLAAGAVVLAIVGYFGMIQLAGGRLTFAVERSDHAAVQEILASETYGQEALDAQLYQAVANGDYDIAMTLIDYGADVDHQFGEFNSPLLHAAALWHEVKATEFLLEQGADPNQVDDMGRTPLYQAVFYRGYLGTGSSEAEAADIVLALLAAGGNPAIANNEGETPLSVAEEHNLQAIAQHLSQ
ncbi:MAG: ankyrin repeat domain-containing protein [Anaerolineae bacterium]